MEFSQAIKQMEKGSKIRRPKWSGYLFLDIDGNIKYSGKNNHEYMFWNMDILESDWRKIMDDKVNLESSEVKQARIEVLMDSNASHIKRLYYLEEIIDGQHKAFKKLADNYSTEMDETRKALDRIVRNIPRIEKKMDDLSEKFYKTELRELTCAIRKLIEEKVPGKREEKKIRLEAAVAAVVAPIAPVIAKISPAEAKEMEEVREKFNTRLALKAKTAAKTVKKGKKD